MWWKSAWFLASGVKVFALIAIVMMEFASATYSRRKTVCQLVLSHAYTQPASPFHLFNLYDVKINKQ